MKKKYLRLNLTQKSLKNYSPNKTIKQSVRFKPQGLKFAITHYLKFYSFLLKHRQVLRRFFCDSKDKQLNRFFKKKLKKKKLLMVLPNFLLNLESRLSSLLYQSGFLPKLKLVKLFLKKGLVLLNNKRTSGTFSQLKHFDFLTLDDTIISSFFFNDLFLRAFKSLHARIQWKLSGGAVIFQRKFLNSFFENFNKPEKKVMWFPFSDSCYFFFKKIFNKSNTNFNEKYLLQKKYFSLLLKVINTDFLFFIKDNFNSLNLIKNQSLLFLLKSSNFFLVDILEKYLLKDLRYLKKDSCLNSVKILNAQILCSAFLDKNVKINSKDKLHSLIKCFFLNRFKNESKVIKYSRVKNTFTKSIFIYKQVAHRLPGFLRFFYFYSLLVKHFDSLTLNVKTNMFIAQKND